MRYDLQNISQLCRKSGLKCTECGPKELAIDLGQGAVLHFLDELGGDDDDCMAWVEGGCWHTHDDFLVRATSDEYFDVCYVDIITGLAERRVLLCERWKSEQVTNREFVVNSGYVYDLSDLRDGEETRVPPAALIPST